LSYIHIPFDIRTVLRSVLRDLLRIFYFFWKKAFFFSETTVRTYIYKSINWFFDLSELLIGVFFSY